MSKVTDMQAQASRLLLAAEDSGWSEPAVGELEAWLSESDLHRAVYLRLEHSWRAVDRIGSMGTGLMPASLQNSTSHAVYRGGPRWVPFAAAACLVVLAGAGAWQVAPHVFRAYANEAEVTRIETTVGMRKKVGLPDGSDIELNTSSVMRAALSSDMREVWLDKGEAYFEIHHDASRPFIVHAGNRQIAVLGTKFSVRREGDKVTVLVSEGKVRVDDLNANRVVHSSTITGGDMAIASGAATLVANSKVRVEDALAWRKGMLSFNQERLEDIASEFNRYNRQQLVIEGDEVAAIRIGGTYPASNPGEFAQLLGDAYGLRIRKTPEAIRISN